MNTPEHYNYLGIFGLTVAVGLGFLLLQGFLSGKTYLFSAWNFFLVGAVEFIAVPCVSLAYKLQEPWGVFARDEVYSLMLGITLFFSTIIPVYYFSNLRVIAGNTFLRWPNLNNKSLVAVAIFAMIMAGLYNLNIKIPVIGEVARIIGGKSPAFGTVLLFCAWYRERKNGFLLALLCVFVAYSVIFGILSGGGRRTIVSALGAIPIAYYWLVFRTSPNRMQLLIRYGALGVILLFILIVYGGIRHRGRTQGVERDLNYAMETIAMIPERFFEADGDQLLGQRAIECSMIANRTYQRRPEPFAALKFIVTNPVPRSLWTDKPLGLGYTLPKDYRARTRATWGPGIVGHAYHEGSLFFVCFYGASFGLCLRLFDEYLARQPENPFLIGTLVAIFPHILGWVRGDIGTFTIQIIGGLAALYVFRYISVIFASGSFFRLQPTGQYSMDSYIALERQNV